MWGPPRIRPSNVTATASELEAESRQILGPTGNKARFVVTTATIDARKSALKQHHQQQQQQQQQQEQEQPVRVKQERIAAETTRIEGGGDEEVDESKVLSTNLSSRRRESSTTMKNALLLRSNSMSPSCSSDASSSCDASSLRSSSRASTIAGRMSGSGSGGKSVGFASGNAVMRRKQQCVSKLEKVVFDINGVHESSNVQEAFVDVVGSRAKKRCAWITHSTDSCHIAFHDEEWGVPVHDDRMLFELLSLSGALAELTWPVILNKRQLLREVFLDFDPFAVSKLNDKKIVGPRSPASAFLSEAKLRAIIENAKQMCKLIEEFGSFDKYIWNFVNHKPIVSHFRYPRQVPTKTSKADTISKDLVKRGFRSVGPTAIYAFMQVSGLTNDHLISCFRFHYCIHNDKYDHSKTNSGKKVTDGMTDSNAKVSTDIDALARSVDNSSLTGQ